MIRYQLRLQPNFRYSFQFADATLSKEALEHMIDGVIVHEIQDGGFGRQASVDLQLDQMPDYEALNAILAAVERCGYQLLEGEVVQWVDAQAQGALAGFVSGAGIAVPTKSEALMMLFGLAGACLGSIAGSQISKHEVIYRIGRAYAGAPLELVPVNDARAPAITLADWLAPIRA